MNASIWLYRNRFTIPVWCTLLLFSGFKPENSDWLSPLGFVFILSFLWAGFHLLEFMQTTDNRPLTRAFSVGVLILIAPLKPHPPELFALGLLFCFLHQVLIPTDQRQASWLPAWIWTLPMAWLSPAAAIVVCMTALWHMQHEREKGWILFGGSGLSLIYRFTIEQFPIRFLSPSEWILQLATHPSFATFWLLCLGACLLLKRRSLQESWLYGTVLGGLLIAMVAGWKPLEPTILFPAFSIILRSCLDSVNLQRFLSLSWSQQCLCALTIIGALLPFVLDIHS